MKQFQQPEPAAPAPPMYVVNRSHLEGKQYRQHASFALEFGSMVFFTEKEFPISLVGESNIERLVANH